MHQKLSSQQPVVQVRNIKCKYTLSRIERGIVMVYVSDDLLNETPLQGSTANIGGTPKVEVEDNEINIGIAEHDVRQEEELRGKRTS